MKLNCHTNDGRLHIYCLRCRQEDVHEFRLHGRVGYRCNRCGYVSPRALIIDPGVTWWLGHDNEYWHETAGVFPCNKRGHILFFERAKYPFGLTVAAGHVDRGESPVTAGGRELFEETRLPGPVRYVATEDIRGDECRRGSDAHRWHAFAVHVRGDTLPVIDTDEGVRPVWLSVDQALRANLTFATRYVLSRHARQILAAAR